MAESVLIFTNSASQSLARRVAEETSKFSSATKLQLGEAEVGFHNDGEPWVELISQPRGRECLVIATIGPAVVDAQWRGVNDQAMQTLVLLDALLNASAKLTAVVIPYLGYLRQDRRRGKRTHRTAISGRVIAELLETVGKRVRNACAVEIHTTQIEGFFRTITFENIPAFRAIADQLPSEEYRGAVVVSPDSGGIDRATALAEYLDLPDMAVVYKRRPRPGEAKVWRIAGEVRGRRAIIVDDILDTGGTLCAEADLLKRECGAESVTAVAVHGLFSADALSRLSASPIDKVYVTDTIPPRSEVLRHPKVAVLSVAELLARTILAIRQGESLRALGRKASL